MASSNIIFPPNKPAATVSEIDATTHHTGNKYHRKIRDIKGRLCMVLNTETGNYEPANIDFYSIEQACELPGGGITHCAKKSLFSGLRGKNDRLNDLIEARDALTRAIDGLKGEMEANGVQK